MVQAADPASRSPEPLKAPDKGAPVSGISQFLGRVLEQLSLSSWMPAAMLVGNLAILLRLRSNNDLDVGRAIKDLIGSPLGTLIALLFALVLASVLIQAFEFEVIRLLEGYSNQSRGPISTLATKRISHHARKRERLADAYEKAEVDAFAIARSTMFALPGQAYSQELLDVLERDVHKQSQPDNIDPDLLDRGLRTNWTRHLPPERLYQLDSLDSRLAQYPAPHRILPTRLGNTLRAAEDQLHLELGENLEGYILRHHQRLPELLKNEHHDYRTRLEMYTSLFFVFLLLSAFTPVLLASFSPWWASTLGSISYVGLAWVSYRASIASASGYSDVLLEVDRHIRFSLDNEPSNVSPDANQAAAHES